MRRHIASLVTGLAIAALLFTGGFAQAEPLPLIAPLSAGEALELPEVDPAIPSPADVLGYSLGTRFTRYADILGYLEKLAAASPRVAMWEYGRTYEDRPLVLVAVSSAANVARLDEIRARRAALGDPAGWSGEERERAAAEEPAVVWLGYGVHGNESSSAEAAMAAAYLLAAAGGDWERLLDEVVVLVDPLKNPDGRERYVHGYQQLRGAEPEPDPDAVEHREPWPGGRFNHYLFDLNRDWAWATQRETRARLAAVRAWEPQVYVDLHEMSSESTYFFPPPAEPVNPDIDPRVVAWLDAFGRGNAAAFDRLGWIYYKAESFDLFYPGYSDSYGSFRDAVGMTYEVAGGGRAGLAIRRSDGSLLTLADRLARHLVASLATVRTAAEGKRRLVGDFLAARAERARRTGPAYLWDAGRPEAGAMASLLARHGIEVRRLAADREIAVRPLGPGAGAAGRDGGRAEPRAFRAGAWVASAGQPLGHLLRALVEPETPMPEPFLDRQRRRVEDDLDAAFYDVTAWALPLAYNVETWVAARPPAALGPPLPAPDVEADAGDGLPAPSSSPGAAAAPAGRVGWLLPPAGLATYRSAARLAAADVRFRVALDELEVGGRAYPSGTLFVPRLGAPAETPTLLAGLAAEGLEVHPADTSFSTGGISLGSERTASVGRVRVGLVGGDSTSPTALGALWHLFDRQLGLDHLRLDAASLDRTDLGALDVLVLPDGDYAEALDGRPGEALEAWLRAGGVLVALEGAVDWLRERELTAVRSWEPPEREEGESRETAGAEEGETAVDPETPEASSAPAARPIDRPLYVPGAVVATELRAGHPLTAGLPSPPPMLVSGARPLLASGEPQTDVVTAARDEPVVAGFAWPESRRRLAGSLLVACERVGRGQLVLFAQDPVFRAFWRGTMPLLLNAVVYGPGLFDAAR